MSNNTTPSPSGKYLDAEAWDAMKAAGFTEAELQADQPFGPMVFSYTRAQAIEDGALVDLTSSAPAGAEVKRLVQEAGFHVPVAMTAAAYTEAVLAGTTEDEDGWFIFPAGQSNKGRLWDVLMVLHYAAKAKPGSDRVYFAVDVDVAGDGNHKTVKLWSLIGPGDDGEPVLTIMCEGED